MYSEFGSILVFIILGVAFVFGSLCLGFFVRLSKKTKDKIAIYECGEPTVGTPWIRYNTRFYNIALVYLLFDVEVVLLVPFALVYRDRISQGLALGVFLAFGLFFALLVLGLAYEWYYGNLDWIRKDENTDNTSRVRND